MHDSPLAQSDASLLPQVQDVLTHESWLLDEGRFDEWLAMLEDDATYWIPMAWQQQDPLNQVSLIYETKDLLHMRIIRLLHPATTSQAPPSRTCRQVTNTKLLHHDDSVVKARSSFMMAEYRRNEQRIFAGFVTHELVPASASYRIRSKRVDLLNCDTDKGLLRFGMPL